MGVLSFELARLYCPSNCSLLRPGDVVITGNSEFEVMENVLGGRRPQSLFRVDGGSMFPFVVRDRSLPYISERFSFAYLVRREGVLSRLRRLFRK